MMTGGNIMGFPTEYVENLPVISDTIGYFKWKRIRVGKHFLRLSDREKQAVLMHEAGHCVNYHAEWRVANMWRALWFPALIRYIHRQELEADQFAARAGYAVDLAIFFRRVERRKDSKYALHPNVDIRVARLLGA